MVGSLSSFNVYTHHPPFARAYVFFSRHSRKAAGGAEPRLHGGVRFAGAVARRLAGAPLPPAAGAPRGVAGRRPAAGGARPPRRDLDEPRPARDALGLRRARAHSLRLPRL